MLAAPQPGPRVLAPSGGHRSGQRPAVPRFPQPSWPSPPAARRRRSQS